MRERRLVNATARTWYVRNKNGSIVQTITGLDHSRISEMSDELGPRTYNDVTHSVTTNISGGVAFTVFKGGQIDRVHEPWFGASTMAPVPSPLAQPAGGMKQFLIRGIQSISPRLSSEVSLPNFLFELKDLPRLFASVSTGLAALRGGRTASGRRTDLGDVASDIHLGSSFGINPLIGDLQRLATTLVDFKSDLETFKRRAGRPQISYYTETTRTEDYSATLPGNQVWSEECFSAGNECKVTLWLKYTYQPIGPLDGHLRLLLRYLGIRGSAVPHIIWNALPYSFVVDWVFKVGKTLEALDRGAVPIRMVIHAGGVSLKGERKGSSRLQGKGVYTIPSSPTRMASRKDFQRVRIERDFLETLVGLNALPQTDGLSVKEVSLAAALLNKLR